MLHARRRAGRIPELIPGLKTILMRHHHLKTSLPLKVDALRILVVTRLRERLQGGREEQHVMKLKSKKSVPDGAVRNERLLEVLRVVKVIADRVEEAQCM
jgi:hypothetical protein